MWRSAHPRCGHRPWLVCAVPIDASQLPDMSADMAAEQLPPVGLELVTLELDKVVGRMPVAGNRQPYGLLHGGASAVLAETLGSVLAALSVTRALSGRAGTRVHAPSLGHRRIRDRHGTTAARRPFHVDVGDRDRRRPGPPHLHREADLPAPGHASADLTFRAGIVTGHR